MDSHFVIFVLVGFAAQLVDGALGMAYGVISTSVLLSIGLPPAAASASVHAAEVVTTGISGASHAMFKNVDRRLLGRLVIPGVIGGVIGAFLLTNLPGESIKPVVAAYLFVMGLLILRRARRRATPSARQICRSSFSPPPHRPPSWLRSDSIIGGRRWPCSLAAHWRHRSLPTPPVAFPPGRS